MESLQDKYDQLCDTARDLQDQLDTALDQSMMVEDQLLISQKEEQKTREKYKYMRISRRILFPI